MNNEESLTNAECDTIGSIKSKNEQMLSRDITSEKISGIYKIVNKVNGKYYVGSSRNIFRRWESHLYCLTRNVHSNSHLQNAWNKYGKENFYMEIMEKTNVDILLDVEQSYLNKAKIEQDKCYNITYIAGGGWNFPPEIMEKIKRNRKYYRGTENQRYGTHLSKNTRQKISLKLTGKILSLETRMKMKNSKLGIKRSQDFCIKNRINKTGVKNHNYDKTIYTFINKNTNEVYQDTSCNFRKKFNLDQRNISKLINKNGVKSVRGWKIYSNS